MDEQRERPLRDRLEAWASQNARLLIWLCVLLAVPWIGACYTLTVAVAIAMSRGTCGG